jgi:hypothetical protein
MAHSRHCRYSPLFPHCDCGETERADKIEELEERVRELEAEVHGDFVESHCGKWWITPIYGGLTRPERYDLQHNASGVVGGWMVVGGGQTQRDCKVIAEERAGQEAM